jgi:hypothetical protein
MPNIKTLKIDNDSAPSKKRNVTFTFGENKALEILLNELEMLFPSMSKTELAKLSLIELRNSTLIRLGLKVEIGSSKIIKAINNFEDTENSFVITNEKELKIYLDTIYKDL